MKKCPADSIGSPKKIDSLSTWEMKRKSIVGMRLLQDWAPNFSSVTEVPNNAERDIPTRLNSVARSMRTSLGTKMRTFSFINYIWPTDQDGPFSWATTTVVLRTQSRTDTTAVWGKRPEDFVSLRRSSLNQEGNPSSMRFLLPYLTLLTE